MKNIAIFASGTGSNAKKIMEYFEDRSDAAVQLVASNNKSAGVLTTAEAMGVDTFIIDKSEQKTPNQLLRELSERKIDLIALAGYLKMIPEALIKAYPDQILNIHPSLLPKYGGKGMYGMNVHQAVFDAGEDKSGMTIHLVNEDYDKGEILFQESTTIVELDSPNAIAKAVLTLEHKNYPKVIDQYLKHQ